MEQTAVLDERTRELAAVSASVAGNCLPCLGHHFQEALGAGCSREQLREAVQIGRAVKERPIRDVYKLAEDLLDRESQKT